MSTFRILSVHIQNEEQNELVARFLQKHGIDYEDTEGEELLCVTCGWPVSEHKNPTDENPIGDCPE
jgi:hypothetical protein